jgi:hypothetical protein
VPADNVHWQAVLEGFLARQPGRAEFKFPFSDMENSSIFGERLVEAQVALCTPPGPIHGYEKRCGFEAEDANS